MTSSEKDGQIISLSTDNLSKNISILMERNGISEADLARSLNVPYNTIRRLVSGFTIDPRISTLKLIANHFNVSLDELTGEDDPSFSKENHSPYLVPVLNWQDISDPNFQDNFDASAWINWQPIALAPTGELSKRAYALETRRSMQPRFPEGTMLIVDPDTDPIDGDLVLIRIKENDAVSLRELIIDPPDWQLLPIIENSPHLLYDERIYEIIGIVVLTMMHTRRS